jgi:hypothetical protein
LRLRLTEEIKSHPDYDEDKIYSVRYIPIKGKNMGKEHTDYFRKGRWVLYFKENAEIEDGRIYKLKRPNNIWNFDSEYKSVGNEGGVKLPNGKKPEKLIQKIVELSTKEGDIVLDFFLGSGTTAAVAHKMNRQYIGIEQLDYGENDPKQRLQNVIGGDNTGISKKVGWGNHPPQPDYNVKTVDELKDLLRDAGLTISGKKADLIARIEAHSSPDWGSFTYFELKKLNEKFVHQIMSIRPNYSDFTIKVLQKKLKEKGLKISGKKPELAKRLMDDWEENCPPQPDYNALTVAKLEERCRAAELNVGGTKAELIARIKAHSSPNVTDLWASMKKDALFDYRVQLQETEEGIKEIDLDKQKKSLMEFLDKNQMYVNRSSIGDGDLTISDDEIAVTRDFYGE